MHARARDLPTGVEAIETGAPAQIGDNPTHHIVRGRRDRYQVHRRIDSPSATDRKDPGETLLEILSEHPRIEEDVPPADPLAKYLTGNHIARSELCQAMALEHESLSVLVEQHRALATHRLRDQLQRIFRCVEGGRMELHEFHVRQPGSRPMRDREAVARRHLRIRRVAIELAAATRRQHRRVSDDLHRFA